MSKNKNQTKTTSVDISSGNWKLIIILLGIFLSVIAGWIVYIVKKPELIDSDRKSCKKILWIFTILEIVALTIIIVAIIVMIPLLIHSS